MEDEAILRDELRSVCRNAGRYLTGLYLKKKKKDNSSKISYTGIYGSKAETNLSMTLYQEGGEKLFSISHGSIVRLEMSG